MLAQNALRLFQYANEVRLNGRSAFAKVARFHSSNRMGRKPVSNCRTGNNEPVPLFSAYILARQSKREIRIDLFFVFFILFSTSLSLVMYVLGTFFMIQSIPN